MPNSSQFASARCDRFIANFTTCNLSDRTSAGLYNLLLPLRSFHRPVHDLQPIILLLELEGETQPNETFLETIAFFPDVYWLRGKLSKCVQQKKLLRNKKIFTAI